MLLLLRQADLLLFNLLGVLDELIGDLLDLLRESARVRPSLWRASDIVGNHFLVILFLQILDLRDVPGVSFLFVA